MAVKNLVSGVLAQSITTSTTNILVNVAQGISASEIQSFFPTPPFYITTMPKSPTVGVANRLDSEILQVTAVGSDQSGNASLTCVRGQRDTTAKAFDTGSIVTVGVYADDAVFLGGEGSAVGTPAPWVDNSDIKNGAITTNKIVDKAITSDKVNWATFPGNYTTKETDTKHTWVDGREIYKRTVVFNQLGNSGVVEQSVSGVGRVVDFEATMYSGGNSWRIPYKYVDIVSFEQGKLRINSLTDLRQYSAAVTIYYIK